MPERTSSSHPGKKGKEKQYDLNIGEGREGEKEGGQQPIDKVVADD